MRLEIAFLLSVIFHGCIFLIPWQKNNCREVNIKQGKASIEVNLVRIERDTRKPRIKREAPASDIEPSPQKEPAIDNEEKSALPESNEISDNGAISQEIAELLVNEPPKYPITARMNGWEGVVILSIRFAQNGAVSKIDIERSSGYPALDESAVRAAKRWCLTNVESEIRVSVPIKFILTD